MRWTFLLSLSTAALASQQPLTQTSFFSNGTDGYGWETQQFTPAESLSTLSSDEFTTLGHPYYPRHSVRIKKSKFCDETVNAYTGYIDFEARHIFFSFFESRNDPSTDDVIFWTNGGPGCSSSLGMLMELGPCRVTNATEGTVPHKESWNTNANVFFIDQPIGVGFSYADYGETVGTTEDASKDIATFVSIFFENFSSFKGRALHLAGESYGGRYIPLFASAIYDQNAELEKAGLTPINLASVMIGNGVTDVFSQILSYYEMSCTPASVTPPLDITTCVAMKHTYARCKDWMQESCIDSYDAINCNAAAGFCTQVFMEPYERTGMNPYDMSKKCEGDIADTLCYPVTKEIVKYLNLNTTRSALGVSPTLSHHKFSSCASDVGQRFGLSQDMFGLTYLYVGALLERGVKVLIYVGEYDWICNWVSNQEWTMNLEWSGQDEFRSSNGGQLKEWYSKDGSTAGRTRNGGGLTFATIAGAGHMVPYDKPEESLTLVQRWLAGKEI